MGFRIEGSPAAEIEGDRRLATPQGTMDHASLCKRISSPILGVEWEITVQRENRLLSYELSESSATVQSFHPQKDLRGELRTKSLPPATVTNV
jgi:hypothetical protein